MINELDLGPSMSQPKFLREILLLRQCKVGAQVGVAYGGTTVTIAPELNVLYDVDDWRSSADEMAAKKIDGEAVRQQYLINMELSGLLDRVVPMAESSQSAARKLRKRGIPLDFVIIDGDHDSPAPERDLEDWWPLVRSGGLMIIDDYVGPRVREGVHKKGWPDVVAAVDAFVKKNGLCMTVYPIGPDTATTHSSDYAIIVKP
jgi:predicted O-methyltransferase YrrM